MIYLLSPTPHHACVHLPMIAFHPLIDRIAFGDAEALLFTSKKAVEFVDAIDTRWRTYPSFAVGEATARTIETLGGRVEYRPEKFYGKQLSSDIATHFRDRAILYLRPKRVAFDIASALQAQGIVVSEQIVYETRCIDYPEGKTPPKGSILLFTSPSTVRCFMRNFTWDPSYTAVAIGETTRQALDGIDRVVVADRPTIEACVAKAQELLRNSNAT